MSATQTHRTTRPPAGASLGATLVAGLVAGLFAVLAATLAGCGLGNAELTPPPAGIATPLSDSSEDPADIDAGREPRPRGSEGWRIDRASGHREIEAFTTASSGVPGAPVGLKVSSLEESYVARAYRIGAYRGGSGLLVWESGSQPGLHQADPTFEPFETRTVVADWKRSLSIDTSGWTAGFYVFVLRTDSGWETQVPYVVSSPSAAGTVALVAPVTTWQAYNAWGGYSLYEGANQDQRSHVVSFDRPYNGTTGANDYRTAAIPIIVRAERTGVPLSYFTNIDLHEDPRVLAGARGYVTMGHDEYWTNPMRQAVFEARSAGTNLAFLSANTMYWRVRLEDRGTGPARFMVGYRHDAYLDPQYEQGSRDATNLFRSSPAPRPEHDLLGMQYECYPVQTAFVVTTPGWWGFRGTGVERGDSFANLVGPEADRVYPDDRLPRPLQILSHSPYDCRGVATSSQSIYYTTPSGAGVFSAGTLNWGCAIAGRCDTELGVGAARFVARVTDNIVRQFARGPVGRSHPARDNVDEFGLSSVNSVPAS